jgi:DNA-binding beta-propeller fold protein YncE
MAGGSGPVPGRLLLVGPAGAAMSSAADGVVGSGEFRYRAVPGWPQLPQGWSFYEVAGVAVDSRDRVFVFSRSDHPVCIFESDGTFVGSWGEGLLTHAHGITIAPDDTVWCTDDWNHSVRQFTPEGQLLQILGTPGVPSDTGINGLDYRSILRAAGPFNLPTNVARARDGSLYISDGYGNCRVHKFDSQGHLLFSWGTPGAGPGEFNLPHGIAVDTDGLVYVADRENSRVQVFTPEGSYLREWTATARPMQVRFDSQGLAWVCDLGWRAGKFPWQTPPTDPPEGAHVRAFDRTGRLVTKFGGSDDPCAPGQFFAPHDLALDSRGNIYVGEVVQSAGGNRGLVDPSCHTLQKFERL